MNSSQRYAASHTADPPVKTTTTNRKRRDVAMTTHCKQHSTESFDDVITVCVCRCCHLASAAEYEGRGTAWGVVTSQCDDDIAVCVCRCCHLASEAAWGVVMSHVAELRVCSCEDTLLVLQLFTA